MDQPVSRTPETEAATALVDALVALRAAEQAVTFALARVQGAIPPHDAKAPAVVRTTSVQIMHVLAEASHPLSLQDIADRVVALRRGEDAPKRGGGTRYQEMCRSSLQRLIARGRVQRVEPRGRDERMRFCLTHD